ncbi:MAG: glycosyltransferase family protein [Gammaproteobacteria bacterium]
MTRIIYGFSGEGSGHSSRTREMARCLLQDGHELRLASYDRGYRNLADEFDVREIEGLTISSEDNRVSKFRTLTENLKRLPAGHRQLGQLRDLFHAFEPHVVITDFEPMTAYLAEYYGIPLITIDNQQRMRYVDYGIPPGQELDAKLTRRLIRIVVPWPSVSLITAFTAGKLRNQRSFLFPPIVSEDVQQLRPTVGDSLLVYLTSGFDSLLEILKTYPQEQFTVYGYDRSATDHNLTFKPASRDGFLRDLASCKGVIATAGFTLISEALFLAKPYLAFPMDGQFEQELNAFQLANCGYGAAMPELNATGVGDFLYRLPEFADQLRNYDSDPGSAIKQKLLELVADNGSLAAEFKKQRKTERSG